MKADGESNAMGGQFSPLDKHRAGLDYTACALKYQQSVGALHYKAQSHVRMWCCCYSMSTITTISCQSPNNTMFSRAMLKTGSRRFTIKMLSSVGCNPATPAATTPKKKCPPFSISTIVAWLLFWLWFCSRVSGPWCFQANQPVINTDLSATKVPETKVPIRRCTLMCNAFFKVNNNSSWCFCELSL